MNNQDLIKCIQAEEEGKEIEFLTVFFDGKGWERKVHSIWNTGRNIYRIKPEPKDIWVNEYRDPHKVHSRAHPTKESAMEHSYPDAVRTAVHYREVIE